MSQSIQDVMAAGGVDALDTAAADAIAGAHELEVDKSPSPRSLFASAPDWLRKLWQAETGPGELGEYKTDPLNPEPESKWGAHIARAVAGWTGGARRAWIDMLLGLVGAVQAAGQRAKQGAGDK